jgi:hypothetical protein
MWAIHYNDRWFKFTVWKLINHELLQNGCFAGGIFFRHISKMSVIFLSPSANNTGIYILVYDKIIFHTLIHKELVPQIFFLKYEETIWKYEYFAEDTHLKVNALFGNGLLGEIHWKNTFS